MVTSKQRDLGLDLLRIISMLTSLFLSMDSIPMAIAGIALFEVFRTIRVSSPPVAPIIRFAAPSAFSVYLISHHPELKVLVWSTLRPSALANSPWLVFHFLISITGIFFVCCVIDLGRQWLFKLLRIDQLLQRIDDLVCRTTEGWMSRFLQAR